MSTFRQTLLGATDELIMAVKKLREQFPSLSEEKTVDTIMRLKAIVHNPIDIKDHSFIPIEDHQSTMQVSATKNKDKYQHTTKCDECGQVSLCLYEPTGPFRGVWRCAKCRHEDTDALADIVKAAERRLKNELPS